ncbi:MAG: hypothetical protein L3K26_03600 [Candidatus Hydrogenedentes bacterium]|nr:hypothetical protein [Candidatus Hydrogenedentota bacterium]
MRMVIVIAGALLWCSGTVVGQTTPESKQETQRKPHEKHGDEIILRSGKSLQGIRVLSETRIEVKVEVHPGIPPLVLPASQVASIQYEQPRVRKTAGISSDITERLARSAAVLLPASKMAPGFSKRLAEKVTMRVRVFHERDIVEILETVARERNVSIVFSQALRDRPERERRCTLTARAEQSLDSFLRDTVLTVAPWLKIDYAFDSIRISLGTK